MKNIKYHSLLILLLLLLTAGFLWRMQTPRISGGTISPYQELLPQAKSWTQRTSPFPYTEAIGDHGQRLGYIILTQDLSLNITGYAGPTPLVLALDPEGKIVNLRALPNDETSSYTGNPEHFLKQFVGASIRRPLKIGEDVDAITHATITSEAMTSTIRETLNRFSREVLGQQADIAPVRAALKTDRILVPLLLLLLACAGLFLKNTAVRWAALLGGFVYFGLMHQTMLSIVQVAHIGLGNIPGFLNNPLWFMTLGIALGGALVTGRIYCGSLCPFALVQDVLHKIVRRPRPVALPVHRRAKNLKYVLLLIIPGICLLTGSPSAAEIEPFVTLFTGQGTRLAWGLLGLMLILAIFYHRFWCVYLCPVGAMTGLFAKFSFFKIKADAGCTHCGTCIAQCPVRAIQSCPGTGTQKGTSQASVEIDEAECILCGRCLKNCPQHHLHLKGLDDDRKR